jgi:hypothetical protein
MKTFVQTTVVPAALCVIIGCTGNTRNAVTGPSTLASAQAASPNADARSLNGTGEVTQQPGVVHRDSIDARLTADGRASGTLTVRLLDLSGFGVEDGQATLVGRIDCLEFDGDSVWFGGVIESSSNKTYLDPVLARTIGQVKVMNEQSYLFSGPALFYTAPGTTCHDRPSVPIALVTNGSFKIR